MKAHSIGHYAAGHEKITIKLDIANYRLAVNADTELIWIEDHLQDYRKRQLKEYGKLRRKACTFNLQVDGHFDMELSFNNFGGDIFCKVWKNEEECIAKMIEIAKKLKCNVYRLSKMIYNYDVTELEEE